MQQNSHLTFSVITVVKNDLKGLIKTYDSLFFQSYNNFEWIVIDGESIDGTKEYLNSLHINNLNFLSEKDTGIYDAMNKGIELANNDYLLFLNAGDILNSFDSLSLVTNYLFKYEVEVLFCGVNQFLNSDIKIYRKPLNMRNGIFKGLPGHHQGTFYSKSILNKIKYDTKVISADYKIIAEIYIKYYFLQHIYNIMY